MNESSSTTTVDPASGISSAVLKVPEGYKVSCWKVSDGSVVHSGETVALVIPIGSDKDDSDIVPNLTDPPVASLGSQMEKSGHKRPSRRKRPLASQAHICTADGGDSHTSTTDNIATVHSSLNDPKTRILGIPITSTTKKQHDSSVIAIQAPMDGIFRMNNSVLPNPNASGDIEIGHIVQCQHPTIVSGLCAVCGLTMSISPNDGLNSGTTENTNPDSGPNSLNLNMRNPNGMTVMTVSGMTVSVSEAESKRMAQEDTHRLHALRKLSLVLDLDHTLLHATADPRAELQCHRSDVRRLVLPFMTMEMNPFQQPQQHNWLQHHFIKLRPHVKEFLESAMHRYEMGVYTAGTREYAEEIAMILARHLVGAERDQYDLDQLRQQFMHTEQVYLRQQATWRSTETKDDESKHTPNDCISNIAGQSVSVEDGASKKNEEEKPVNPKRKKVQFGVSPPSTKTDEVAIEFLSKMREELNEAERLEQLALNMRQKLFGSRVMSRTEAGEMGRHVKSLKRIFPCGGSMAAVIDDREDVWANADEDMRASRRGEPPENLLLVRPYHWSLFHGYADVNNASGFDFLNPDATSEIETDEQLLWTANVLNDLHRRYYSYSGPNRPSVPDILELMRSSVLKGCNIVLSGLVPLAKQNTEPSQPRPSFVRYAESLGAVVHFSISSSVTHVVAAKDGTDKILAARQMTGCMVVRPTWLIECLCSLTRRDETPHLLGIPSKPHSNAIDLARKEEIQSNDMSVVSCPDTFSNGVAAGDSDNKDDEDDDDDFAADLENEMMNYPEDLP